MNCSKCGAPIDEGAVFCGECGAPVAAAPVEAPAAPVSAPEAAPVEAAPVVAAAATETTSAASSAKQNLQNAAQSAKETAGKAAQSAKQTAQNAAKAVSENEIVGSTVEIFKSSFAKPTSAGSSVIASKNLLPGMLLIAVQCAIVLILFTIHYPGVDLKYADFGHRLGASFIKALAYAALYAVTAYGITLKKDPAKNITFKAAFSAVGTQTVYSTCLIVLTFVFGMFMSDISSMLSNLSTVIFAALGSKVVYDNVEGDDDTKSITSCVVIAVAFLCMFILNILASKALWA